MEPRKWAIELQEDAEGANVRRLLLVEVMKERDPVPLQTRSVVRVEAIVSTRQTISLTLISVETAGHHGDQ